VPVREGEEVDAINVSLQRGRTVHVRGTIIGADGSPTMRGSLNLMPSQRSQSAVAMSAGARRMPDGTFEFPNIPPGEYVIQAYTGRRNAWTEGEFGALLVNVADTDVDNLVLQMSNGRQVSGRLRFEASDPAKVPPLSQIEVVAVPVDLDFSPPNNWSTADIHQDGTFAMAGMSGGRRLQVTKTPPGWALKEIRAFGADVTDRPLAFGTPTSPFPIVEVVLTDRLRILSGRVLGDDGRPIAAAAVIAFSIDRDRWYDKSRFLKIARTSEDGTYAIEGLAFGNYYAIAVTELPAEGPDAWQAPSFLEASVRRASSVIVREGERTTLDLRAVRSPVAP